MKPFLWDAASCLLFQCTLEKLNLQLVQSASSRFWDGCRAKVSRLIAGGLLQVWELDCCITLQCYSYIHFGKRQGLHWLGCRAMLTVSILLCIVGGPACSGVFDFILKFSCIRFRSSKFFVLPVVKEKKQSLLQLDKGRAKAVAYRVKTTVLTFRTPKSWSHLSCNCCLDRRSFFHCGSWLPLVFVSSSAAAASRESL